jgi:hypothetical protein
LNSSRRLEIFLQTHTERGHLGHIVCQESTDSNFHGR